jgi:hypothetical protein
VLVGATETEEEVGEIALVNEADLNASTIYAKGSAELNVIIFS